MVCTDRGTHPSRDLGLIDWTPPAGDGVTIWDPEGDPTRNRPQSLRESGRTTNAGTWRTVERHVDITTRADGGETFKFPPCPWCGRRYALRDDTLSKVRRAWPGDTPLDASRIGRQ